MLFLTDRHDSNYMIQTMIIVKLPNWYQRISFSNKPILRQFFFFYIIPFLIRVSICQLFSFKFVFPCIFYRRKFFSNFKSQTVYFSSYVHTPFSNCYHSTPTLLTPPLYSFLSFSSYSSTFFKHDWILLPSECLLKGTYENTWLFVHWFLLLYWRLRKIGKNADHVHLFYRI